jgi:hypothetical protein
MAPPHPLLFCCAPCILHQQHKSHIFNDRYIEEQPRTEKTFLTTTTTTTQKKNENLEKKRERERERKRN